MLLMTTNDKLQVSQLTVCQVSTRRAYIQSCEPLCINIKQQIALKECVLIMSQWLVEIDQHIQI